MTDFEHRVQFQPGYNYLHEKGPSSRGQHGMAIRFALIGPAGATQFLMQTFWTPLGEVDAGPRPRDEPVHVDYWRDSPWGTFGTVNTPSGSAVSAHWATPPDDDREMRECDLLPGGKCYLSEWFTLADDYLRAFINEGEPAVWRLLEERYQLFLDEDKETTT